MVKKIRPKSVLFLHKNGQWCKKILGKLRYFGTDPDKALVKYHREREDWEAGRIPSRKADSNNTAEVVEAFLGRCLDRAEAGELSRHSLRDYRDICKTLLKHLGKSTDPQQLTPADFAELRNAVARRYSLSRITKVVTIARQVFRWAFHSELIEVQPRFGPDFKIASAKARRLYRATQVKKLFTPLNIRSLLAVADAKWRAIVLLGINGGLGNSDIACLRLIHIEAGWLDYPRGKTGIDRRIPLWPETLRAIEAELKCRPSPQHMAEELVFLSKLGGSMIPIRPAGHRADLVAAGFKRLAVTASIHRKGMGFYWLRHTFQTIADGAGDPVAASHIMGHADHSMAGVYRERIDDSRLMKVTDHVHSWLFNSTE